MRVIITEGWSSGGDYYTGDRIILRLQNLRQWWSVGAYVQRSVKRGLWGDDCSNIVPTASVVRTSLGSRVESNNELVRCERAAADGGS